MVGIGPSASGDAVDEADVVSRQMRGVWTDFATSGHPGWAAYDPATAATRIFDQRPAVAPYPEQISREIWRTHPTVLVLVEI